MKKWILVALLPWVWLAGCHGGNKPHIEGKIIGLKKGTVYLKYYQRDSVWPLLDSVHIKGDPHFRFSLEGVEPRLMALEVKEKPGEYLLFFSDDTLMKVYTQLDKFGVAKRLEGGINLHYWQQYRDMLAQYNDHKLDWTKERWEAVRQKDSVRLKDLDRQWASLEKRRKLFAWQFSSTEPYIPVKAYVAYVELRDNPRILDTIYRQWPSGLQESFYGRRIKAFLHTKTAGQ